MERWTPHPFQIEGVKFLLQNSNAGLFWSPGCGKTSCVLAAIAALKMRGMFRRALVVAPRRPAKLVWPKERDKWVDFMGLTIDVLHGPKKDQILDNTTADICVVTPEGLKWLMSGNNFLKLGADVLVVDESSYFRTPSSGRFKNLKPVLHTFKRRIILTATPAPKSYENLWSQAYILDMGGALGSYITHYRRLYFFDSAEGVTYSVWQLIKGAEKVINEKLKPLVLREDAIDHLEMPKLISNVISVELDSEARAIYDEMEKKFWVLLAKGAVEAVNAAVCSGKLRQIANGFLYLPDHSHQEIHDEKIDEVVRLVEELQGNPVMILYEFNVDRDRLREAFARTDENGVRIEVPDLGAGCTDREADAICDAFNAGTVPVLLAHPASAGHGLNLQGQAQHIVWYGPTWNLEFYEQATARVWRQGNPHDRVFVHTLVVADSVEEQVAHVLADRDRQQKTLLASLKRPPQVVVAEPVQP